MSRLHVADPAFSSPSFGNGGWTRPRSGAEVPRSVKLSIGRYIIGPRKAFRFLRCRPLQVNAVVGYPASVSWWKKGTHNQNMLEINSSDQFYDALGAAARQDKLVMVDFYSAGCRSCKALHPKICQLALENPDIDILTINFHDNLAFCRSLSVNVLPFFHFYRGSKGRIDAFACSLSKIDKLRAAVVKHQGDPHLFTDMSCSEVHKELLLLPMLASVSAAV